MSGLVTDIRPCCVSALLCSDGVTYPLSLGARGDVLGEELRGDVEGGKPSVVLWLDLSLLVSLLLGTSWFCPIGTGPQGLINQP